MKPWRTREELVSQATSLARTGMSVRAISRALQVNRVTVKKLLAAHHAARRPPPGRRVAPAPVHDAAPSLPPGTTRSYPSPPPSRPSASPNLASRALA